MQHPTTKSPAGPLGIVPSLEVLPFFADLPPGPPLREEPVFQLKSYSSYGEIIRDMLTGRITGGVVPWEIFVSDLLALPGQRTHWKIPLFLQPCPTELVLRESIYRAFYPASPADKSKLPARLTVGVESQNSLTKSQVREWLAYWKTTRPIEVEFKMLPMDLMMRALDVEALDAIIAPSPWGIHAESAGLGKRDSRFSPGKFAQQLVMVCRKEWVEALPLFSQSLSKRIAAARSGFQHPKAFEQAIARMLGSGKPPMRCGLLEQAASLHSFISFDQDFIPDISKLVTELMHLDQVAALPAQVAPSEQTARLLLAV